MAMAPDITNLTLIDRLKANKKGAWEEFEELYGPYICGWAKKFGHKDSDIEDVVQEVLIQVYKYIQQFEYDATKSGFRGWLFRVIRTKSADQWKNQQKAGTAGKDSVFWEMLGNKAAYEVFIKTIEKCMDQEILNLAMNIVRQEFEERSWLAFYLTKHEQQPPSEVAEQLGMGMDALYQNRRRVLNRLKEVVARLLQDDSEG